MKTKIIPICIGGCTYYLAQYKPHWWNTWKYVNNSDTNSPHLFKTQLAALLSAEAGLDCSPP